MAAHPERLLQHVLTLAHREAGEAGEAELLRRFVHRRDEDAFAALIARHGPMVLGVCRRLLRDAASAEDVAQATFLVLARKAGSVRAPGALAAWLHRTACHLALKHRRADVRRRDHEARGMSGRPASDPAGELAGREMRDAIDEEVGALPERFRLPVILCGLEGRTVEDAAERLGWTPGSVKGRLERGRAELRDRLVRRGFALSAAVAGLDVLREGARAGLPAGFGAAALRAASAGSRAGLGAMSWKVAVSLLLTVGVLGGGVAAVSGPERAAPKVRTRVAPPVAEARKVDRQGDALPAGALARLGTVRWRSANTVDAIAFAPDGKTLAVATRQGVRLFDAKGKLTREFPTTALTSFHSPSFSPNGKRLACRCTLHPERAKSQEMVRIWDLGGEKEPKDHRQDGVRWVGWSATGEPLAVRQAQDAVVVMRELTSGKEHRFEAKDLHPARLGLFECAYARASSRLAFADSHAVIHVWDVSTGKKVGTVETKAAQVPSLAISADGRSLASLTIDAGFTKRTVELWDVASGKKSRDVASDPRYTQAVAFSPDGKTLATFGTDVRLWDASTGRERSRTPGTRNIGMKFAFSPDSKTLATASYSGTVLLWDVATAEPKAGPVGHTNGPGLIDFSPDGKRVATSDGTLIVWEEATGEPWIVVRGAVGVLGGGFSADGSRFSCYAGGRRITYAVVGGRRVKTKEDDDPVRTELLSGGVRLSRDRKMAYGHEWITNEAQDGSKLVVKTWEPATFKPIIRRTLGRVDFGVAVSSDLRLLARSQGDDEMPGGGPVRIEDLATGEHLQSLPQLKRQTGPMEFSPDGRLLTVWNRTSSLPNGLGRTFHTLRVWEVATASEILSVPTVMNGRVAFSSDGRLMAVSAPAGEIVLWDLRRDTELQRFKNFDADVVRLAFSPDARRLVSGLSDTTLLVWPVPPPAKARRLDAASAAQAWDDLASDPKKAFAARGSLADSPTEAVALLKKRLAPVRPAQATELRRLLAGLDDDTFTAREKAKQGLEALGDRATEALRRALEKKPSAEARKRIQALLRGADGPVADRETLRSLRAVGVLEDIGSPEARAVLEALVGGAPGARLTREAKATLGRLGRP